MAIDLQKIINRPSTVCFVTVLARAVPPSIGYLVCDLTGRWAATRRQSSVTQAVRLNQWVARGATLKKEMLDDAVRETLQNNARDFYDLYHSLERPDVVWCRICLNPLAQELIGRPEFAGRGLVVTGIDLARFRHLERPLYGYFLDHTTDSVTPILIFCGLGLSPYVSFNVACVALVAYLVMCIVTYLRTSVSGEFKISYGRLGPTESRVVAVLLNIAMYFLGIQTITLNGLTFSAYDLPVLAVALILFGFFFNTAWQETRRLAALGE